MFSPYYALARRRGRGDPENFCALNVALYGAAARRWTMTERGRTELARTPEALAIGPSGLRWEGDTLIIDIDERGAPLPTPVRGQVRVHPGAVSDHALALDAAARHCWWPLAPCARVEVDLDRPALRWSGDGYLDSNAGDEPLEQGFRSWHWCRASSGSGTTVVYDLTPRHDPAQGLALHFPRAGGEPEPVTAPCSVTLPPTLWRIDRQARSSFAGAAAVVDTLEDTPFYARSLIRTRLGGGEVAAVHETLSLDRFASPWVQLMLPFRMPRRAR